MIMMSPKQLFVRFPVLIKNFAGTRLNIFEILEQDHVKVEGLYFMYRMTRDARERARLAHTIRQEIETHTLLEEKIFYPACDRYPELRSHLKDAREKHAEIKKMLSGLERLNPEKQLSRLQDLMSSVSHHVREEETEMFPECREVMSEEEIEILSRELLRAKSSGRSAGTHRSRPASISRSTSKARSRKKASTRRLARSA